MDTSSSANNVLLTSMTNDLESLRVHIESMSKKHHIEILKIIRNNVSLKINENKNGVFVNLALLPPEVLRHIAEYINYIGEQESDLQQTESKKTEFKNAYFFQESAHI